MSIDVLLDDAIVATQVVRVHFKTQSTPVLASGGLGPINDATIFVGGRFPPRNFQAATWPVSSALSLSTSYADIYTATGEAGLGITTDFSGATAAIFHVWWSFAGSGVQTVRLVEAGMPSNVLLETASLFTGKNETSLDGPFPAWVGGNVALKLQAKSTVALDAPTLRYATLLLTL